jgi:hypothetical protein
MPGRIGFHPANGRKVEVAPQRMAVLANLLGWRLALPSSGYFTVSNSSESETPNARASR